MHIDDEPHTASSLVHDEMANDSHPRADNELVASSVPQSDDYSVGDFDHFDADSSVTEVDHFQEAERDAAELDGGTDSDEWDRDETSDATELGEADDCCADLAERLAPIDGYLENACRERKGLESVLAVITAGAAETTARHQAALNRELSREPASLEMMEHLMPHMAASLKFCALTGRLADQLMRFQSVLHTGQEVPQRLTAGESEESKF